MSVARKTPLYGEHTRLKAKMVEFAGWDMPLQYSSIIDEVKTVRNSVGIFDISHMGRIVVEGPQTVEFVNHVITNDFAKLNFGEAVYSPMCNDEGGIIDDLVAYKVSKNSAYLVVNAANREKDLKWLESKAENFKVVIRDVSEDYSLVAVQGPKSEELLQKLANVVLKDLDYYHFTEARVRGIKGVLSRTGYTGEDGFEIMVSSEAVVPLWRSILEYGEEYGMKPAGLGARDILRLEASYLLYGNDIDESTNPLEAGLSWTVKFEKGDFVGKEALLRIKEEGLRRKLIGFEVEGRSIPRHGSKILKNGEEIGFVTSGNFSPTLEKTLGLGYVNRDHAKTGTDLEISVRGKTLKAKVVKLPFYRGSVKRRK